MKTLYKLIKEYRKINNRADLLIKVNNNKVTIRYIAYCKQLNILFRKIYACAKKQHYISLLRILKHAIK